MRVGSDGMSTIGEWSGADEPEVVGTTLERFQKLLKRLGQLRR